MTGPQSVVDRAAEDRRPLRRDAEANRRRILEAAGQIFADRGLEVSMDDIAAAAGVGVATLYRRFPDKQELVDALFGQRIGLVAQTAADSLELDDPWEGVAQFLRRTMAMQLADRGLAQLLRGRVGGRAQVVQARATIEPLVEELVARAQASGQLRPDVAGPDLAVIGVMVSQLGERFPDADPGLWERYLDVILDGLRTSRRRPTPLGSEPMPLAVLHAMLFPEPVS
jgi:AcrR family transcriptional regulator